MRLAAPVLLAWLVAGVCGNGLRAAYEQLMLFEAYQIDQLLPDNLQTIGFKCRKIPDPASEPCPTPDDPKLSRHIRCEITEKGSAAPRPCKYLPEFLEFINAKGSGKNKKNYKTGNIIPGTASGTQRKLNYDIEATAKNMNEKKYDRGLAGWRIYKDTCSDKHRVGKKCSYNAMFDSVFDAVAMAKSNLPKATYDANIHLFERFEKSRVGVHITRLADRDAKMVAHLEEKHPGIEMRTSKIGLSEYVHNEDRTRELFVYDELKTIQDYKERMPDIEAKLQASIAQFTAEDTQNHKVLIETMVNGGDVVSRAAPACR